MPNEQITYITRNDSMPELSSEYSSINSNTHESCDQIVLDPNEYRIIDDVVYQKFEVFKTSFQIETQNSLSFS
jgi:hypothetical protein